MTDSILLVEDEDVLRGNIARFLGDAGYRVTQASTGAMALERLLAEDFALLITDLRLPELDGLSLLKRAVAECPETSVLIITAYASIETAIEALRHGAVDYMLKPIVLEDLRQKVVHLLEHRNLKQHVALLRRGLCRHLGFEGMIGESLEIQHVFSDVEMAAPTDATILLEGESGTGKELLARAIHAKSARAERVFLPVNMAAVHSDTADAQLFGHLRGAFTGAVADRDGIFRSGRGGTVFLDEISELPLPTQAKLLRTLEAREVYPVGADLPEKIDVRLVVATNQDLEQLVANGRFRQDLFFRLNVFRIRLPALRDRREDIPLLVQHFWALHGRKLGRPTGAISNEAMRTLNGYHWPGNVRELSNVIERAAILSGSGQLERGHLPPDMVSADEQPIPLKQAVEQFEQRHIAWVLSLAEGSKQDAARLLGVDVATLYRRLARNGS